MPTEGSYLVPSGLVETQSEVRSSRFLAAVSLAATKADAQIFVNHQRKKYPEASHHCFGFRVGPPQSTMCIGCSDDGEPHSSAGRPILDVLIHSGFGDIVCVVTRWFGGTKLGRGGLVRAYGEATQGALAAAVPVEKVDWIEASLNLEYAQAEVFSREVAGLRVEKLEEQYGATVQMKIRFARSEHHRLGQRLRQLTRGAATLWVDD
ncbi:MAG: YigZ family protein [Myxococcales bacterium]|nr:YigZ family protein [Myxococcales bacterium]